jgi:hypothetical protein
MKTRPLIVALGLLLAALPSLATAAESPALQKARAELLDAYKRGSTDQDNSVQSAKAEIERLEYLAAHGGSRVSDSPMVTVDFPGGPASALIAAINKAGGSFNVIGDKGDLAIELPPLSVRNADAASFAGALAAILPSGYMLSANGGPGPGQVYTLRKQTPVEAANTAYALSSRIAAFQSFQLAAYLDTQTVDDIVSAIHSAWELDPSHKPDALHVKFHPPTGILLVSCPQEGIMIVQSVLQQLRKNPEPKSPAKITGK